MKTHPKHPGFITFVQQDGLEKTRRAEEVPESIRFAPTPNGETPVSRVVSTFEAGSRAVVRDYDANGELVRTRHFAPRRK